MIYIINHIIISLIRGYLRFNKHRSYYYHSGRMEGALLRGIKKRVLRPLTFIYSAVLTLGEFLVFNVLLGTNIVSLPLI